MAWRDRTDDFVECRLRIRRDAFGTLPSTDRFQSDKSVGWMEDVHAIEYDIQHVEKMSKND